MGDLRLMVSYEDMHTVCPACCCIARHMTDEVCCSIRTNQLFATCMALWWCCSAKPQLQTQFEDTSSSVWHVNQLVCQTIDVEL